MSHVFDFSPYRRYVFEGHCSDRTLTNCEERRTAQPEVLCEAGQSCCCCTVETALRLVLQTAACVHISARAIDLEGTSDSTACRLNIPVYSEMCLYCDTSWRLGISDDLQRDYKLACQRFCPRVNAGLLNLIHSSLSGDRHVVRVSFVSTDRERQFCVYDCYGTVIIGQCFL
jgi:hypothetical protein